MELVDLHLLAFCLMISNDAIHFDRALADAKVLMLYPMLGES